MGPYPFVLFYWLLRPVRVSVSIIFCYKSTKDLTKLQ